ncbi:hypothetical protein JCM10213_005813 [Rhodosporidiobolus nylandii]
MTAQSTSTIAPAANAAAGRDKGVATSTTPFRPVANLMGIFNSPQHLWAKVKTLFEEDAFLACIICFVGTMIGGMFVMVCYEPTGNGGSWAQKWTAASVDIENFIQAAAERLSRALVIWPMHASVWLFGSTFFLVSHALLIASVGLPTLLLYSSYTTRRWPLSSFFPSIAFTSLFARILDFTVPPALIHLLFFAFFPSALPFLFFPFCAVCANAALHVTCDASAFFFLLTGAAKLERLLFDAKEHCPEATAATEGSNEAAKEVERLEKEIAALKAQMGAQRGD